MQMFALACSAAAKYPHADEQRCLHRPACQQKVGIMEQHGRPATSSCLACVKRNFCHIDIQYPMFLFLRECQIPIAIELSKSKFNKNYPLIFEPRK